VCLGITSCGREKLNKCLSNRGHVFVYVEVEFVTASGRLGHRFVRLLLTGIQDRLCAASP
jgi:hypothetical protein